MTGSQYSPLAVVSDDEVNAYVDNALSFEDRIRIEGAIEADPELRAQSRAYRTLNAGLKSLYDPSLENPVPERLREALYRRCDPIRPYLEQVQWAYSLYSSITEEAELDEAGLTALMVMLGQHLGVELPEAAETEGFRLVWGQAVPARSEADSIGAILVYANEDGHQVSLYVQPGSEREPISGSGTTSDDLSVYYWMDGPLLYALAGAMDSSAVENLAQSLFSPLRPDGSVQ